MFHVDVSVLFVSQISTRGRIVEAEAEEARLAAELELVKAEEAQKALELEEQQQREAVEHQLEIGRRKLAAESERKRVETEQALKVQVQRDDARNHVGGMKPLLMCWLTFPMSFAPFLALHKARKQRTLL